MAYSCASMKAFAYDERADDYCLGLEDEPKPLGKDNCMREGIELQPLPIINIG